MNRMLGYAKGFAKQGYEVHFYFLITNEKRERVKCNIFNVSFHYLWEGHSQNKYLTYLVSLCKLYKQVNKGDVIFIYGGNPILLSLFNKKKYKIYSEITEHPFAYKKRSFINLLVNKYNIRQIGKSAGLFVISHSLKDYYKNKGIDQIFISNMFVDLSRFDIAKESKIEQYVAYCGTVSIHKDGVDDLIRAFKLFYNKYSDYKLLIIGKTESKRELLELKEFTKELDIEDSVVFKGFVKQDKIPSLLCNAKILALARPNNLQTLNGFPTKLGEYLATGNPVVVTRVGELDCYLKDNVDCIFARPNDYMDFAKKLISVADNYDNARIIGNRGKIVAGKEFSYSLESAKVLKVIKRNE